MCLFFRLSIIASVLLSTTMASRSFSQTILLDADQVSNSYGDRVGLWLNSTTDHINPSYQEQLQSLKLRSLRYGWQFGVLDKKFDLPQVHSPRDLALRNGVVGSNHRLTENFGAAAVADLLDRLSLPDRELVGFAIMSTDGIRYTGNQDKKMASLSEKQRTRAYATKAAKWSQWSTGNRFKYFEIGRHNDLSGQQHHAGVIEPWSASQYAKTTRELLRFIKHYNPNAKCGINGGLRPKTQSEAWFREIIQTDPKLADDLDFLVAHKDEPLLDFKVWSEHPGWEHGRLSKDYRRSHQQWFPDLAIHVTEMTTWKLGENPFHYRSLIALEMLGNVRQDAAVEYVHFWPSRRGKESGVFKGNEDQLSPMGLGLASYTRFAGPEVFGHQTVGTVRCFATKSRDQVTIWLVNHSTQPAPTKVELKNATIQTDSANPPVQTWHLTSRSGTATAPDTVLQQVSSDSVQWQEQGDSFHFSAEVPPISATIIQLKRATQHEPVGILSP